MANINTMCKALTLMPDINVYAVCDLSMSWLLEAGEHTIDIPQKFVDQRRWCSYVPINGCCSVSTQGFMWDLGKWHDVCILTTLNFTFKDNHKCSFGGLVSTSNTFAKNRVSIKTDGLLFWSMGICDLKNGDWAYCLRSYNWNMANELRFCSYIVNSHKIFYNCKCIFLYRIEQIITKYIINPFSCI